MAYKWPTLGVGAAYIVSRTGVDLLSAVSHVHTKDHTLVALQGPQQSTLPHIPDAHLRGDENRCMIRAQTSL